MQTSTHPHTPGPWHVQSDTAYRRPNDGEQTYDNDSPLRIVTTDGQSIADLAYINGPEEADARLIAAAPALLDALLNLTHVLDAGGSWDCACTSPYCPKNKARAAIAAATGDA